MESRSPMSQTARTDSSGGQMPDIDTPIKSLLIDPYSRAISKAYRLQPEPTPFDP